MSQESSLYRTIKKLTVKQIIAKAYHEADEDIYMAYIEYLRKKGTHLVFDQAKHLIYSKDPIYREIGADILAQFGFKTKCCRGERAHLFGKLLNDSAEDVVANAVYGLGHNRVTRYLDKMLTLMERDSIVIDQALAFALGGYDHADAATALITLMQKQDFDTRNWATFEIAQICEADTPVIREALYQNLSDKETEIRGEAMLGLARRKDQRVVEAIIEDLQRPFYGSWILTAIVEMPDNRYLQYFDGYIDTLEVADKKAFQYDIEEARVALMKYKDK